MLSTTTAVMMAHLRLYRVYIMAAPPGPLEFLSEKPEIKELADKIN